MNASVGLHEVDRYPHNFHWPVEMEAHLFGNKQAAMVHWSLWQVSDLHFPTF